PHFDQLFKRTVAWKKALMAHQKLGKPEKLTDSEKPPTSKVSAMFGGTREKCIGCNNTVTPLKSNLPSCSFILYSVKTHIKISAMEGVFSPSNYIAHEGRLYCKHHHTQLIKEKGNLSQLEGEKDPVN
ncbi:unnamed protein product, partial [Thlaspi arvense]